MRYIRPLLSVSGGLNQKHSSTARILRLVILMKQALNDQFSAVAAKVFLEEAEGYHDQMVRGADDLWMDPQDELIDVNMDIRWEEVKGDDKATRLEHRRKQMEKFVDKASKMVKTEEEKKRKAVRCTEEEVEAMQKFQQSLGIKNRGDFDGHDGEEAVAPRRASKVDQEMARRDKADREKLDQVMAFVDRKLSSMEEGSEVRIHAFLELMQASFDDVDRMAKETIKDLTEKSKKGDLNLTPGQVTQKLVVALKRYKESDRWLHWVNPHGDKKVTYDSFPEFIKALEESVVDTKESYLVHVKNPDKLGRQSDPMVVKVP